MSICFNYFKVLLSVIILLAISEPCCAQFYLQQNGYIDRIPVSIQIDEHAIPPFNLNDYMVHNMKSLSAGLKIKQGSISIGFIIDTNGRIIEPKLYNYSAEEFCTITNKDILKLLSNIPAWKPAKKKGKKVPIFYALQL